MNELPEGWVVKKLGEVCEKAKSVKRNETNPTEEFTYLDIGGIDNKTNSIVSYKTFQWKDAPSRAQQIIKVNDVLFSTVRTYLKNIAFVDKPNFDNQIASSGFTVLRAKKDMLSPKFLFYYSVSETFLQPLNELQTGSSYPAVRDKDVFEQSIPLPPLPVQQAIVAKIEEIFSELDKGVQQLETARQQLKVYRQSVLKWAFEGKLTNENVVDGELLEGWKWVRISEIGKVQLGRQRSPKNVSKDFPTKYIRAANITENGLSLDDVLEMEFNPTEFVQYKLEYGDLILSEASGSAAQVGKPAIWKNEIENCCFQNTVIRLRPKEESLSEFLLFLFKFYYLNGFFAKIAGGVGINHLSAGKFSSIEIPIPPLSEQHRIVAEIERRLSVCEALEVSIEQSLRSAAVLRQGVLGRAFSGRLVGA